MAAPIYNPIIPCVHPIPGGMYPGRMIRVQGNVPPGGQRFAINFQCGPNTDPRDDIALHLNFRFVEMCVVRNHLTAMNWGVEETAGGMPLARGESFEALILCEPQSIKVALNGIHFCEFLHRVPFQRISHLTIDGDVHVQFIGFEGAQPPPQQMYMAEPPAYGSYGAPPPAYGAPGYGGPQGYAVAGPGAYQTSYAMPQQRSGMGTGAAVGLGVGALAAGGLAGYALGGGFSRDSPTSEGYINTDARGDDDYLHASAPQEAENVVTEAEAPIEEPRTEEAEDDDYLDNDNDGQNPENVENANESENSEAVPEDVVVEGNDIEAEINEGENTIPPYVEVDELAELVENKLDTHDENVNETEVNEEDNAIPPYVEPVEEGDDEAGNAEVNEEDNTIPPYQEEIDEPQEVNIVDNFGDGDWME